MKRALWAMALASAGAISVVGCANKKNSGIPKSESVADISAPAAPAYTPAPAPQPVVYDTAVTAAPGTSASAVGSLPAGPYTVKRGDTLYSISRQRFGDGKQWNRIVAANPGLRPESLKVGQTITIP